MKKAIILILLSLILTGCYNYNEIEKTAIIDAISIDYDNDYYLTTFEIIKNTESDNLKLEANYVTGSGKNIVEAFSNAERKIDTNPFFSHLELIIVNKEIITNHFNEITNFILRNPKINNNIKLVATNSNAKDILTIKKDDAITSNLINQLIKNNYNSFHIKNTSFDQIVDKAISYGIASPISLITVNSDNTYQFDGMIVIDNNIAFNSDEVLLFNILNNNCHNIVFSNNKSSIRINKCQTKINLVKKEINIKLNCELSNNINHSKINEDNYKQEITKKLTTFYQKIKENNIDLLGINQKYYKKNHHKKDYFNDEILRINVDLIVDKYGLINEDKYE